MNTDQNLEVVNEYFKRMTEGNIDGTFELLDDSGSWWQNGRRFEVPMANFKEGARATLETMPMEFTVLSTIAKDDKVVAEVESHASPNGESYNNIYCFVFTMGEGRIVKVRQYADTVHANGLPENIRSFNRYSEFS